MTSTFLYVVAHSMLFASSTGFGPESCAAPSALESRKLEDVSNVGWLLPTVLGHIREVCNKEARQRVRSLSVPMPEFRERFRFRPFQDVFQIEMAWDGSKEIVLIHYGKEKEEWGVLVIVLEGDKMVAHRFTRELD